MAPGVLGDRQAGRVVLVEPDWGDVRARLMAMPMRKLRPIGRRWFSGMLGGSTAKGKYVGTMVDQMRYWWRSCADRGGRERVSNVLKTIAEAEREG